MILKEHGILGKACSSLATYALLCLSPYCQNENKICKDPRKSSSAQMALSEFYIYERAQNGQMTESKSRSWLFDAALGKKNESDF